VIDKFFYFPFLFILTCNPDGYINKIYRTDWMQNLILSTFNTGILRA